MLDTFESDAREIIRTQLEKLENFAADFAPRLSSSDIFAYVDRWEKATLAQVTGRVSPKQLQRLKNVRLKQRFELAQDEQAKQLICGFKSEMREWLEGNDLSA